MRCIGRAKHQLGIIEQQYAISAEKINHTFRMSVDFFGSAEREKTQSLLAALQTRVEQELAAIDLVQAKYASGSKEYQRIEDEKTKITRIRSSANFTNSM